MTTICMTCRSEKVREAVWREINSGRILKDGAPVAGLLYCEDCQKRTGDGEIKYLYETGEHIRSGGPMVDVVSVPCPVEGCDVEAGMPCENPSGDPVPNWIHIERALNAFVAWWGDDD